MADFIKKIKTSSGATAQLYDIFAASADTATSAQTSLVANVAKSMAGVWVNTSGNFEINSTLAEYPTEEVKAEAKLNLVSDGAIQVKPGDGENLQLDCERNVSKEDDMYEYTVRTCNGAFAKAVRTVGLKLNTAEITLDSQKANTDKFNTDSMDIKFRYDKWNGGAFSGGTGPIQAKLKARSFDIRCHDHGGIALQIAGRDNKAHENKIKFESDRIVPIGTIVSDSSYCKEGGKGMEFGTFNNEHSSLYTGDYRFKGDAMVYGCTRGTLSATTTGKIDYPTQSDDFKDILPLTGATWNEILKVAKDYADGIIGSGGTVVSGVTPDMSKYATTAMLQTVSTTANTALSLATDASSKVDILSASTDVVKYITIPVDKGNLEINMAGVYHYKSAKDVETLTSAATREIIITSGESAVTVVCANTPSNVTLESLGIVKSKANNGVEFESPYIGMGCKLSKKGRFSYANYETEKLSSSGDVMTEIEKLALKIVIENNCENTTIPGAENIQTVSVPIYKLIKLIDKVEELENRVKNLEEK